MAAKCRKPDTIKANKPGPKATDWRPAFLKALALSPFNIAEAAKAAGVSRGVAYEERDKNPAYTAVWDAITEAAVDGLETVALDYARSGAKHECMALLIFMLKARRKAIYGGVGDGPERPAATIIFKDGRDNA